MMTLTTKEEVVMSRIVVGVDESEGARAALRWAVREAQAHDGTVLAVLAWGFLDQHPPGADLDPGYSESDAAAALGAIVSETLDASEEKRVEQLVVCDLPARALLDVAVGADLLVVGARGLGGFAGLLLGSVSQRCLHHLVAPTVVVREVTAPFADGTSRYVVGVDGSPGSRAALEWAVREARVHGAGLDVVHAYQLPYVGGFPYSGIAIEAEVLKDAAREVLSSSLAAVDHEGVDTTTHATFSTATAALLAAADGARMVVVGSRGAGAVKRLVLGSVADQVARHAPCPVTVVPSEAHG